MYSISNFGTALRLKSLNVHALDLLWCDKLIFPTGRGQQAYIACRDSTDLQEQAHRYVSSERIRFMEHPSLEYDESKRKKHKRHLVCALWVKRLLSRCNISPQSTLLREQGIVANEEEVEAPIMTDSKDCGLVLHPTRIYSAIFLRIDGMFVIYFTRLDSISLENYCMDATCRCIFQLLSVVAALCCPQSTHFKL
jgi:hypothetical protein